ncbi:unnamed protein product [Closterium sp. NIES-54]
MAPGQQASAVDLAVEGAEDEEEGLEAATSTEAAGVADTAMTTRTTDAVADGSTASVIFATRSDTCGAIATSSLMDGLLLKAKRVEEQEEGEEEAMEAVAIAEVVLQEPAAVGKVTLHSLDYWVIDSGTTYSMTPRADLLTELEPSPVKHVTSALGQQAEVKGMGKAMFKGADGKMVGLKNAGMDTSSNGAKTYTARLGERILWDLHEDRDVYNEMWQIPVVPMPKERQVAASISTKGEAVGSGDGVYGRAKEIKSKKCNLGVICKLAEHEESGAVAKKQHKDEENPKAVAEEEYGDSMWGTIASAAFSNPTSATGECDWLTFHRRIGHVALPILQQLVKNEMVAGICVKGEPDEVLGCPTCMQANFTRYPFSSSEATAKAPLDEVVMDVVGPLKLGAAGAEYLLTIVDVYTRMTWVYMLSKKSNVAETAKTDWLPMVERQQDRLRQLEQWETEEEEEQGTPLTRHPPITTPQTLKQGREVRGGGGEPTPGPLQAPLRVASTGDGSWAGAAGAARRGSRAARGSFGRRDGAAGAERGSPGQRDGAAGAARGSPGQRDGAAGAARGSPGRRNGVAGAARGSPGQRDGAAWAARGSLGQRDGAAGAARGPSGRRDRKKKAASRATGRATDSKAAEAGGAHRPGA